MPYEMNWAFIVGSAHSGLTLTAQLVNSMGANVGMPINTGFTELGPGQYLWNYTQFPDNFRGAVVVYDQTATRPDGTLIIGAVNPEEGEWIDHRFSESGKMDISVKKNVRQVEVLRGDDWNLALNGIGEIGAVRDDIWFSVKESLAQGDPSSTVQVTEMMDMTYLNGAPAIDPALGSLQVNDATLGNISIIVMAEATQWIAPGVYGFDVQSRVNNIVTTHVHGTFIVTADATRAVL